ncbi:hypothetical protein LTR37_010641 [Vermiconidia calcicola]|uniref:Uncharacterized protein n=1 Tax=Vermiconidia calcicola TaxID=1690605 RepID=A0ACC3N5H6_9PEZI|nr:hypothetical protein LTR37_010641 [Vermiconidia calcicola]
MARNQQIKRIRTYAVTSARSFVANERYTVRLPIPFPAIMATSASIPKTMHAWRKHRGTPEPQWDEIPVPACPPNGLLVKVLAAGVCHSDVGVLARDGQAPYYQEKFVVGHEGCGDVFATGADVSDFKIGSRRH